MTQERTVLRKAVNQRIRHGKADLRRQLRRTDFSKVLKHPALTSLIGDMIRERAARPALFPILLGLT